MRNANETAVAEIQQKLSESEASLQKKTSSLDEFAKEMDSLNEQVRDLE